MLRRVFICVALLACIVATVQGVQLDRTKVHSRLRRGSVHPTEAHAKQHQQHQQHELSATLRNHLAARRELAKALGAVNLMEKHSTASKSTSAAKHSEKHTTAHKTHESALSVEALVAKAKAAVKATTHAKAKTQAQVEAAALAKTADHLAHKFKVTKSIASAYAQLEALRAREKQLRDKISKEETTLMTDMDSLHTCTPTQLQDLMIKAKHQIKVLKSLHLVHQMLVDQENAMQLSLGQAPSATYIMAPVKWEDEKPKGVDEVAEHLATARAFASMEREQSIIDFTDPETLASIKNREHPEEDVLKEFGEDVAAAAAKSPQQVAEEEAEDNRDKAAKEQAAAEEKAQHEAMGWTEDDEREVALGEEGQALDSTSEKDGDDDDKADKAAKAELPAAPAHVAKSEAAQVKQEAKAEKELAKQEVTEAKGQEVEAAVEKVQEAKADAAATLSNPAASPEEQGKAEDALASAEAKVAESKAALEQAKKDGTDASAEATPSGPPSASDMDVIHDSIANAINNLDHHNTRSSWGGIEKAKQLDESIRQSKKILKLFDRLKHHITKQVSHYSDVFAHMDLNPKYQPETYSGQAKRINAEVDQIMQAEAPPEAALDLPIPTLDEHSKMSDEDYEKWVETHMLQHIDKLMGPQFDHGVEMVNVLPGGENTGRVINVAQADTVPQSGHVEAFAVDPKSPTPCCTPITVVAHDPTQDNKFVNSITPLVTERTFSNRPFSGVATATSSPASLSPSSPVPITFVSHDPTENNPHLNGNPTNSITAAVRDSTPTPNGMHHPIIAPLDFVRTGGRM